MHDFFGAFVLYVLEGEHHRNDEYRPHWCSTFMRARQILGDPLGFVVGCLDKSNAENRRRT